MQQPKRTQDNCMIAREGNTELEGGSIGPTAGRDNI
jgi:hypothetical protein